MTYTPGMEYKGNNEFLSKTIDALNTLNSKSKGGEMIGHLNSVSDDVIIMQSWTGNKSDGFNVGFDVSSKLCGIDVNGNTNAPPFIGLGHELAHVWDNSLGTLDSSPWYTSSSGKVILNAEKFATHIENQIRSEHFLPLRTHYSIIEEASGSYRGDPQSRILDGNNRSIFYKTTTKITLMKPDGGLWDDAMDRTIIDRNFADPFKY
jgi:hypothetical protein